jgi:DNA-binding NarL/FixJ family response regulator
MAIGQRRSLLSAFTHACVAASESLEAWCDAIAHAAAPVFASGGGVGCFTTLLRERVDPYARFGVDPYGLGAQLAEAPSPMRERLFSGFRVSYTSTRVGRRNMLGVPLWQPLAAKGMVDAVGMLGGGGARGVVLNTAVGSQRFHGGRWGELLTMQRHLARSAAARLAVEGPEQADAIVSAEGKVIELRDPETRSETLAAAVAALERSCLADDAENEAARLWQGVMRGEWSCIEHVDRDGKRLMLLHRRTPRRERLTPAESAVIERARGGMSGKRIALELGVGQPTVSTHLRTGLAKLGFESRAELVRYAGHMPASQGERVC